MAVPKKKKTKAKGQVKPGAGKFARWAMKYVREHPLKVAWSTTMLVGGLFALLFFVHVGFLPEVDLANVTALLAAIALIGVFITAYLVALFSAPGGLLRPLVAGGLLLPDPRLPAIAAPLSAIATYFVLQAGAESYGAFFLGSIAVGLLGWWVLWWRARGKGRKGCEALRVRKVGYICGALSVGWGLWVLFGAPSLLVFFKLYSGEDGWMFAFMLVAWLTVVGIVNSSWACSRKPLNWVLVVFGGLFALFFLFMQTDNFSVIPASTVRLLRMGEVENVYLDVSKAGCSVVQGALHRKRLCSDFEGESKNIGPFKLRSRIGGQYLIEVCGRRVVLNKADVIGWSEPVVQDGKSGNPSSAPEVSSLCSDADGVPLAHPGSETKAPQRGQEVSAGGSKK